MVLIRNHQRSIRISLRKVKRDTQRLLGLSTTRNAEIGVLLVNDDRMKRLNSRYRGIDRTTDVLSFPQWEGEAKSLGDFPLLLGDIVINLRAASKQAPLFGNTFYGEVRRLLVHGFLHLLGYDHERGAYQERKMKRKERELLRALEEMDRER